jgi:hypothetical protein
MLIKSFSKIAIIAIAVSITLLACKKNVPGAKPVLRFVSASSYDVKSAGGLLTVTLECDNLADLKTAAADTALGVQFIVTNPNPCTSSSGSKNRIFRTGLPETSEFFYGKSQIVLNWANNLGVSAPAGFGSLPNTNCRPIDSTTIRFWVTNKAGITSDTIQVDKTIVIRH